MAGWGIIVDGIVRCIRAMLDDYGIASLSVDWILSLSDCRGQRSGCVEAKADKIIQLLPQILESYPRA